MKTVLVIVLVLLGVAIATHMVAASRFVAKGRALAARLETGPPPVTRALPEAVRDVAIAGGAEPGLSAVAVRIRQEAQFLADGAPDFVPTPAIQTIALGATGFVWQAENPGRPVPKFRVIDAFVDGEGLLEARALGSIPAARATGQVANVAEAMRYLAELPWVPDAILGNPEITWTVAEDGWIEASLRVGADDAMVRFRTEGSDIVQMTARRPDLDADGNRIERVWEGHFRAYGEIGGRRIPIEGEIGYVDDGHYTAYWIGRITGYEFLE